jgi:predicted RNA-binding protein with RPS1 domain
VYDSGIYILLTVELVIKKMTLRHQRRNPGNFSRTSRARQPSHFDNPEYVFRSIILKKSLDEFANDNWVDQRLPPLEIRYKTVDEYFDAFIPHLFEEARAIIRQGLQELIAENIYTASEVKRAKNPENPSTIYFADDFPDNVDCGHSCVAVKIEQASNDSYRKKYLGLAFRARPNQNGGMRVKLIIDNVFFDRENVKFNIGFLGSLLQVERMYTVCMKKPDNGCVQEIIHGRLSPWPRRRDIDDLSNRVNRIHLASDQKEHGGLNDQQQMVCEDFLRAHSGVYLLQGPPGTGKTTTIAHLVSQCVTNRKLRILVSAPSNKAIHVLAERILPMLPEDLPVAMAGVSEKVPDELRGIFVHEWSTYMVNRLEKIKAQVLTGQSHQTPVNVSPFITTVTELLVAVKRQLPAHSRLCDSLLKSAEDYIASVKIQNPNQVNQRHRATRHAHRQYPAMRDEISSNEQGTLLNRYIQQLQNAITKISGMESRMLSQAIITFFTSAVAGRSSMEQIRPFNLIIYDEAGQSVEPETMLLFLPGREHTEKLHAQKILLVGDPKQLPATTVAKYSDQTFYSRSMMERLQVDCEQPTQMLTVQYRMEPRIRRLPSYFFYNDKLEDGPNIQHRNNPLQDLSALFQPLSFIDVSGNNNEGKVGRSYINKREASAIVYLLAVLNQHYPHLSIGVISFYRAQIEYLRTQINRRKINNTIVQTVDGFQGGERDMIIISSVRSNRYGNIGFLRSERRLNVAITRARFSLITFGSGSTIMAGKSDYFIHQWLENLKEQKLTFTLENIQQQLDILQQYGAEQAASHFHTADKNPWENIKDRYHRNQIVPVRIDKFSKNNIQVTLEPDVSGLIPYYEIKPSLAQIQAKFKQGDTINVRIVNINEERKSIRLSLKRVAPQNTPPADRGTAEIGQLQLNEQYEGTITRVTRNHYHVRIVGDRVGILPNLQNRNTRHKARDTVNYIKVGDKVIVQLVEVDLITDRIDLKLVRYPVETDTPAATAAATSTVGMFSPNSGRGRRRRQWHASAVVSAIPSEDNRYPQHRR